MLLLTTTLKKKKKKATTIGWILLLPKVSVYVVRKRMKFQTGREGMLPLLHLQMPH